ncbi:MAG: HigA family addiction module antitoxin [Alphaproteobacteria bacterium]|nr:HigA family addiction module antitoxin [Alphaproteobacteria bacterium]
MARVTTHPGEFLKEDLMEPLRLTAKQIAEAIHVPQSRLSDILNGRRAVTADTALRLEAYFGVSAETWMTLQQAHDLSKARAESNLPDILPCPDLLGHNAA